MPPLALLVALLGVLVWSAPGLSPPAVASCVSSAPPRSPYAFTGVVTSIRVLGPVAAGAGVLALTGLWFGLRRRAPRRARTPS